MSGSVRSMRGALAVVLFTAVAFGGAFVWFFQDTPFLNRSLLASRIAMDPARITTDERRAFLYPSRWFGMGDDVDRPRSALRLFEDGVALAPSHAKHDLVRGTGGGAWSHWTTSIFFSSTDGSDPRTNGRRYEIEGLTIVVRWGSLLVAIVAGILAIRSLVRLGRGAPGPAAPAPAPGSSAAHSAGAAVTPAPTPRASRRRRLALTAASIAVTLLLIVGVLAVIEVVLRVGKPEPTGDSLRLAQSLGWERALDPVRTIASPGVTKSGTALRVLMTGDSFVHGKGWPDKCVAALDAAGVPVIGFESGVSGYGTTQQLMQLRQLIPEIEPDVVVLLFYAWNDLRDNWPYPAICYNPQMTLRPYMDEAGVISEPSASGLAFKRFELWKEMIEPTLDPMRVRRGKELLATLGTDGMASTRTHIVLGYDAPASWRPFYLRSRQSGPYVDGAWRVTARAFREIRDLCRTHGAELIVMALDNPFTVDADVAERWLPPEAGEPADDFDVDLPLKRLAAVLGELGVPLVDLVPALRAYRDRTGAAKLYDGKEPGEISGHLQRDAEAPLVDELIPRLKDAAARVQRLR